MGEWVIELAVIAAAIGVLTAICALEGWSGRSGRPL